MKIKLCIFSFLLYEAKHLMLIDNKT